MNALALFVLIALPFVALATEIPVEGESAGADTNGATADGANAERKSGLIQLEESQREQLLKELEESAGGDRMAFATPFGVGEAIAFHCTYINNLPGRTVCCRFSSLYLLQCYSPLNFVAAGYAPYGVGVGVGVAGVGMAGVPIGGVGFGLRR